MHSFWRTSQSFVCGFSFLFWRCDWLEEWRYLGVLSADVCLVAPLNMPKVAISGLLTLYLARWDVLLQKKLLLVWSMLYKCLPVLLYSTFSQALSSLLLLLLLIYYCSHATSFYHIGHLRQVFGRSFQQMMWLPDLFLKVTTAEWWLTFISTWLTSPPAGQ